MTPENNVEYLAAEALAAPLGISLRTFQRQSKKPGFPAPLRIGRCCRWSKAEVLAFLREDHGAPDKHKPTEANGE
jgi:predicted DNA-binding transcriptional regulator AlpA